MAKRKPATADPSSTATIELENIAAIKHATIPLPDGGGVAVLRGTQGTGKSTALRAVSAALGAKAEDLSVRDGATKGSVQIGAARLNVSRGRTTRGGELVVESIESRFDLGAIIDPGIADVERADAARIKQLLALSGQEATLEPYRGLLPPGVTVAPTDDPIALNARVVRALQAKAREHEDRSRLLERNPEDTQERLRAYDDVRDITIEQATRKDGEARKALAVLEGRHEQSAKHAEQSAEARQRLEEIKAGLGSQEEILRNVLDAQHRLEEAGKAVDKAKSALLDAEKTFDSVAFCLTIAERDRKEHERQLQDIQSLEAIIADSADFISTEDLEAAAHAVADSEQLVSHVRERMDLAEKLATELADNAKSRSEWDAAEACRVAAVEAEKILQSLLPAGDIRVSEGRLVVTTDRSNNEFYSELSHGERSILAIKTAAKYVPAGGLVTISQELWSGISPENKQTIIEAAKEHGIVILTAEVTDDPELTVTLF